jgi:hypothetical protein
MISGAGREGRWRKILASGSTGEASPTKNVSRPADLWLNRLPQKVMDVSYFAETKGVVGCH